MKPGDLVVFVWPGLDDIDADGHRIGLVVEWDGSKHDKKSEYEICVLHEGKVWVVPTTWCRRL